VTGLKPTLAALGMGHPASFPGHDFFFISSIFKKSSNAKAFFFVKAVGNPFE